MHVTLVLEKAGDTGRSKTGSLIHKKLIGGLPQRNMMLFIYSLQPPWLN